MYAIKEAIVALEHEPDLDLSIFFMDMRTQGKGFEEFYERGKQQGITFVRSKVSSLKEIPGTKNLIVHYAEENGTLKEQEFDLVVLSVGIEPAKKAQELASTMKISLNDYRFARTNLFSPVNTSREGIFVAGAFQGPKDIPETVIQSSGSVASASSLLASVRGTLVEEQTYPDELPIEDDPRIGVFVCHCGINVAGVVDVGAVKEYAGTLPNVVFAEQNYYSCSQDNQENIKNLIKEHNLNRVVVTACSPRTHEPLFQETLREAGLNKCLFEMANIRDQCSWVHMHEKEAATEKTKDLLRMAVAKANRLAPLTDQTVPVIPKGLVIGGGVAGMTAALEIARQGFECSKEIIEGENGFMALFSKDPDIDKMLSKLGEEYYLPTVSFKPYAACGGTHSTIDTMKKLREQEKIDVEDVKEIEIEAGKIALDAAGKVEPKTGLEGKFSTYYCAALALAEGEAGIDKFTDKKVNDPKLVALRKKVKISVSEPDLGFGLKAVIRMKNGMEYSSSTDAPKGDPLNPVSYDELAKKFKGLASSVIPKTNAEKLISKIKRLEQVEDIESLFDLCKAEK